MKTWLITGCSSGIGKGIARAVLEQGDNAVVTARSVEKLQELTSQYPNTSLGVYLDVTKEESIDAAVRAALEHFGFIDVLVNNAGYGYRSSIEEGETDSVNQLFSTNFFGPIELIKRVLPQMREHKCGAIINISSIGAVKTGPGSGYYAASKAALELAADALAQEVKPLGIKVMTVEPGAFRTSFYDTSLRGTQIRIEDYAETAGKMRKENIINQRNQPGDPDKAGRVIVDVIGGEDYPRCLLLGSDAVNRVVSQMSGRMEEAGKWKEISVKTDF